ncbi:MAG TPA: hypothetical protein VNV85_14585 [Puia sp.]|nr:hypothetical protein [Puia sp.]
MRKLFLFTFMLPILSSDLLFSQSNPDSVSSATALQNSIDFYYAFTGVNSHLYIGTEYGGYNIRIIGSPYFDTAAMQNASIYYNGTLYYNVPMLYDILNDDVIINRYNQNFRIRLAKEKISYFSLLAHTFIRIVPDSTGKALPGIGFYDRIYNGRTEVLVKRTKAVKDEPLIGNEIVSRFLQHNSYFVKKHNIYFQVGTRKSLLKLFDDRDKQIRKYLRKNKIKFRQQPENTVVKAAQYYDQLTN